MSSLIRWSANPARDLLGIRDEVDRLFDSVFQGSRTAPARTDWTGAFVPPLDIEETKDEYVLRADLPGVNQKDVKVTLSGDTLTIRGERRQVREEQENDFHRTERIFGAFERTVTVGVPVRTDQVKASYRDGVLEIRIPKAEEAKVREIDVQIS